MKSKGTSILLCSCLLGGAALLKSVAPFLIDHAVQPVDIAHEACPNRIENYRNSVNWYQGPNRITIRAKSACGSKYGDEYELSDVTVEIRSGKKVITQVHASDGAVWPASNEILIGKSDKPQEKAMSCIPEFELMQIDLKSGEMKTPGMRAMLNSKDEVECARRRSHG